MPHCDKFLYELIIKQNIDHLSNVAIIGNDFRNYIITSTRDESDYWKRVDACVSKSAFSMKQHFRPEVFNDTVMMRFEDGAADELRRLMNLE